MLLLGRLMFACVAGRVQGKGELGIDPRSLQIMITSAHYLQATVLQGVGSVPEGSA